MAKRALILGIGGQDGSYLAEFLLAKGYDVHGLVRRSSVDNLRRIAKIRDRVTLHQGDVTDVGSVENAFLHSEADEIYNMADQDHVGHSLAAPGVSWEVTFKGCVNVLECAKARSDEVKMYQPVSATIFGNAPPPQNEQTPLNPTSPYAVAKAAALHACRYYWQCHGVRVSCGIHYNHDSPRRQGDYLLHKICREAVEVAVGERREIVLGDLDLRVDVGWAEDHVVAAWRILQLPEPVDLVLGTGVGWGVKMMAMEALLRAGVSSCDVQGAIRQGGDFHRPGPRMELVADCTKAKDLIDWSPRVKVAGVIARLVEHYQEKLL